MSSFHDQWMEAWKKSFHLPGDTDGAAGDAIRAKLSRVLVLIDDDNDPQVRQVGGRIIRDARKQMA